MEYKDWGISGRRDDRPQYVRLKAAIGADQVCCVFAYSLSRLGRSARELDAFLELCKAHGVMVQTQAEGSLTASTAMGSFLLLIMRGMAELESEVAKERSAAARAVKVARGDELGQPIWGMAHVKDEAGRVVSVRDPAVPVETVLEAVREAGTILGAVRVLNEQGIPSPKGGEWHTSVLTRIVKAHDPDLLRGHRNKGRPAGLAILAGLVRCHCGQMMTPNAARRQLYCYQGNRQGVAAHGRAHVREADIFPWIMNRATEVREEADLGQRRANAEQRQAELVEQRERLGYALTDGLLTREQATAKAGAIDTELAQIADDLAAMGERPNLDLYEMPEMDPAIYKDMALPDYTVEAIHGHLRSLMRYVQLDTEMRPVSIEWTGA